MAQRLAWHLVDWGSILADRYQLLRPFHAGGMSYVYAAQDLHQFRRSVAIKILHQDVVANSRQANALMESFAYEARVSMLLGNHPNIVKVLDMGVSAQHPFLVMELLGEPPLKGYSLAQALQAGNYLEPVQLVRVARQICAALHYAHQFERQGDGFSVKGVIHRDIKPSNIFILEDSLLGATQPYVKVLDFGIARVASEMAVAMGKTALEFLGTPQYASPEQLMGESLDPRSDIYSLGVVMYQMLSGQLPLQPLSNEFWPWAEAHTYQVPLVLQELCPTVPPMLADIVMQCLAKDPRDRPASMAQLCDRLTTCMA